MSTIDITPSVSSSSYLGMQFAVLSDLGNAPRGGVPVTIPKGELYYWSARWQADERESLDSIARGDVEVFDSEDPSDAVRWLLRDDEE